MLKIPQVSEAEARVMEALWEESPLSAESIMERIAAHEAWSPSTVKTLITRLAKKGAIGSVAEGRRFLYHPLFSREAYLKHASRSFLDRLFGGKVAPLVSHFAHHHKLSARDIADLKRILKELEGD